MYGKISIHPRVKLTPQKEALYLKVIDRFIESNGRSNGFGREKLHGPSSAPSLFAIRANGKARLILRSISYQGEQHWCVVAIYPEHEYEKLKTNPSHWLYQKKIDEQSIIIPKQNAEASKSLPIFVPNPNIVLIAQKYSLLDKRQQEATTSTAAYPMRIHGAPGSGKTSTALIALSRCPSIERRPRLLYIAREKHLATQMKEEWEAQAKENPELRRFIIDFLTPAELNIDQPLVENNFFSGWLEKHVKAEQVRFQGANPKAKKQGHQNQEEQSPALWAKNEKLVRWEFYTISGYVPDDLDIENPEQVEYYFNVYNTQSGIRHSFFKDKTTRRWLFDSYLAYIKALKAVPCIDSDFHTITTATPYDQVVVDEAQDLPLKHLKCLRSFAKNDRITFCIGSHQQLEGSASVESFIDYMYHGIKKVNPIILQATYRCSQVAVELLRYLLRLKTHAIGGTIQLYREDIRSIEADAQMPQGQILWLNKKQLAERAKEDFVVITPVEYVKEAKEKFPNALVFTPKVSKGLQFPGNVLLYRPLDTPDFKDANSLFHNFEAVPDPSQSAMAHESDGSPIYTNTFNELFVALSRCSGSTLLIYQNDRSVRYLHDLLKDFVQGIHAQPTVVPHVEPVAAPTAKIVAEPVAEAEDQVEIWQQTLKTLRARHEEKEGDYTDEIRKLEQKLGIRPQSEASPKQVPKVQARLKKKKVARTTRSNEESIELAPSENLTEEGTKFLINLINDETNIDETLSHVLRSNVAYNVLFDSTIRLPKQKHALNIFQLLLTRGNKAILICETITLLSECQHRGFISKELLNLLFHSVVSEEENLPYSLLELTITYLSQDPELLTFIANQIKSQEKIGQLNKCLNAKGANRPTYPDTLISLYNLRKVNSLPQLRVIKALGYEFTDINLNKMRRSNAPDLLKEFATQFAPPEAPVVPIKKIKKELKQLSKQITTAAVRTAIESIVADQDIEKSFITIFQEPEGVDALFDSALTIGDENLTIFRYLTKYHSTRIKEQTLAVLYGYKNREENIPKAILETFMFTETLIDINQPNSLLTLSIQTLVDDTTLLEFLVKQIEINNLREYLNLELLSRTVSGYSYPKNLVSAHNPPKVDNLPQLRVFHRLGYNLAGDIEIEDLMQNKDPELIKEFHHTFGLKLTEFSDDKMPAIYHAIRRGNAIAFSTLIELDANLLFANPDRSTSIVCKAAEEGHVLILATLLKKGVNLNPSNCIASPALIAACHGKTEALEFLFMCGACNSTPVTYTASRLKEIGTRYAKHRGFVMPLQVEPTYTYSLDQLLRTLGHIDMAERLLRNDYYTGKKQVKSQAGKVSSQGVFGILPPNRTAPPAADSEKGEANNTPNKQMV